MPKVKTKSKKPRIVSHKTLPLSESSAMNRRFRSPQNTTSPAVATTDPLVSAWPR